MFFFFKKEKFLLACFIALIGSLGNVLHGACLKYYSTKLHLSLYELITISCIVEIILLFPFCIKCLKHFAKGLKIVILLAILYSSDILLYNTGLKSVSVNTGTLIMLLVPLWMCLFGKVILHEKDFNMVNGIALCACICAVIFTIYGDIKFDGFSFGIVLIFLNSIILPIGVILQKKFSDKRPIIYALFTNAIVLCLISFCLSGFNTSAFKNINLNILIGGIVVAITDLLECGGVYLSCKLYNVSSLQPIRFTRIIFAVIISNILLNEHTTKYQIFGIVIILLANFISILYTRLKK